MDTGRDFRQAVAEIFSINAPLLGWNVAVACEPAPKQPPVSLPLLRAMPTAAQVWLTREQQDDFARSRTLAARWVQRAKIILLAAARKPDRRNRPSLGTRALWRGRFIERGIAGIDKDVVCGGGRGLGK